MAARGRSEQASMERVGCCTFGTTGKSLRFSGIVSSLVMKNILLYRNKIQEHKLTRPVPSEGRFAIVTIRRAQDAMDAVASGRVFPPDENAVSGRRSRVVLAPRPWRQVGAKYRADDGGKKRRSPGRARISRKTIARGKPGCLGCTCRFNPCAKAHGVCYGCIQRPAFPAPSLLE